MMKVIDRFYRHFWISLIALSALLLIAAQGDVPEFSSLQQFLLWIATGGGAMVLAGLVVAYLLENLAFWHNLPRVVKLLAPIVIQGIIGVVAQSAITLDLLSYIPPQFQAVLLMMIGWLFSQIGYRRIKEGNYGDSARAVAVAKLPQNPQVPGPAG